MFNLSNLDIREKTDYLLFIEQQVIISDTSFPKFRNKVPQVKFFTKKINLNFYKNLCKNH